MSIQEIMFDTLIRIVKEMKLEPENFVHFQQFSNVEVVDKVMKYLGTEDKASQEAIDARLQLTSALVMASVANHIMGDYILADLKSGEKIVSKASALLTKSDGRIKEKMIAEIEKIKHAHTKVRDSIGVNGVVH